MFDVFQNVLFGKKKSSDTEKDKSVNDDFVMIGQASNDSVSQERDLKYPSFDPQFPKPKPSPPRFENNILSGLGESPKKEVNTPIMPLQGVPFTINSTLYASSKLDQIWQSIAPKLAAIGDAPYQGDYDFSLEKSVIAETANK